MQNLFVTWILENLPEAEREKAPTLTSALRVIRAARPADAAIKVSDYVSRTKHPFYVTVAVMRAEDLGNYQQTIRKYEISFRRAAEISNRSSIIV